MALLWVPEDLCGFWAPAACVEPASSPWLAWDVSPTLAEAVVPPENPYGKDQHDLSNVN